MWKFGDPVDKIWTEIKVLQRAVIRLIFTQSRSQGPTVSLIQIQNSLVYYACDVLFQVLILRYASFYDIILFLHTEAMASVRPTGCSFKDLICKSYTVACLPPERKYLPITYLTFAYFPVSAEWYCVGITVHFASVSCSYINCSQYQLQKDHWHGNFVIYKREIPQKLLKYTIYFCKNVFRILNIIDRMYFWHVRKKEIAS